MSATMKPILGAVILVGSVMSGTAARAQSGRELHEPEVNAPLEPLRTGIAENQIFAELVAHNELRTAGLVEYSTLRVKDLSGRVHEQEIGQMEYHAPDRKTFVVKSEDGSGLIRRLALTPLIASEIEAASGKKHSDSSITSTNYTLKLLGERQVGVYHCFVAQAIPKRKDKYMFEGKVWIDTQDYAIVRIEGHPAKKLSFWIERADIVRQYQKIGLFWLPEKDETIVHVRLYGKKVLTIDHDDYIVNGDREA